MCTATISRLETSGEQKIQSTNTLAKNNRRKEMNNINKYLLCWMDMDVECEGHRKQTVHNEWHELILIKTTINI